MRKELGKIRRAEFGHGGYSDGMIGISFVLGGDGWGVGDHWGFWSTEHTESCKWSNEDRDAHLGKVCMRISDLLKDAKVKNVSDLIGVPIEVKFDGNALSGWRILKEVL